MRFSLKQQQKQQQQLQQPQEQWLFGERKDWLFNCYSVNSQEQTYNHQQHPPPHQRRPVAFVAPRRV